MSQDIAFYDAPAASQHISAAKDIYYTPEYGVSAELIDGGNWECAVDMSNGTFFPYLRRDVSFSATGQYDIVSPYGYGGVCSDGPSGISDFRKKFLKASRDRGLVAEFVRTNPFDYDTDAVDALGPDEFSTHSTFGVGFIINPDEYFTNAEGRHRTAVRKAGKSGLEVSQHPISVSLDPDSAFRTLYRDTMERVGAGTRLKLGTDYFDKLCSVGDEHGFIAEAVDPEGAVLASSVFLLHGNRVHYHLSGSTPDGQKLGATNLLIDWIVRNHVPPRGLLHLGGGVGSGDGLEKFKRSIASDDLVVHLCRTVVNRDAYDELCRRAKTPTDTDGYFPAYRAK